MDSNIFKKMAAISAEIETVAKKLSVGYGNSTYKAVAENDILEAVKPLEAKHGVYSYPVARELVETQILEQIDKYDKIRKSLFLRIKVTYRFVDIDNPTSYLEVVSYGDGVDSQDKAPGKAMTYSDKYALMKAYKIATGEDPDSEGSLTTTKASNSTIPPIDGGKLRTLKQYTADYTPEELKKALNSYYKVDTLEQLNMVQAAELLTKLYSKTKQTI
jgi:hypothetical protein